MISLPARSIALFALLLCARFSPILAAAIDDSSVATTDDSGSVDTFALMQRTTYSHDDDKEEEADEIDADEWWQEVTGHRLEKRRGGGGRGGGGGGRSGGGRSGGSSGGRTSRSGSSSSSSPAGSNQMPLGGTKPSNSKLTPARSSSNAGGRSSKGSGSPRPYGGGAYYGGGAAVPYSAGKRSLSGIVPFLIAGAALASLPGLWALGAFAYPFSRHGTFHNHTSNSNETLPVLCVCQAYQVCGCDENHNETYTQALYDNATALPEGAQNFTSKIASVNGTKTLVINGTLANGTTAAGSDAAGTLATNWGLVAVALVVGLMSSYM